MSRAYRPPCWEGPGFLAIRIRPALVAVASLRYYFRTDKRHLVRRPSRQDAREGVLPGPFRIHCKEKGSSLDRTANSPQLAKAFRIIMKKHLITFALALMLLPHAGLTAELPDRHPLDNSETRTLVLDNGLEVVLVSDPDIDIASASMAVGVGSYANPEEAQGLAHFLEHMLFLGTEKYPDEGEYTEYLTQNGGYSNAYTSGDHTNYHFEVFPNAFEGALDRFAQFFIAPLFTAEFTERELNAVDSEFQKNIEDDDWRSQHLRRMYSIEDHPENQFSTGNLESLGHVTREELITFYERYYSANQMALALVSTHSLDQLEAWVRTYFSEVENQGYDTLRYPEQYLELDGEMQLVQVKAIQDRRELILYFNTPGIRGDWDAKSAELVGSILGYEGEGSLLSDLKEANLATALGAGVWEGSIDYTTTSIGIDLTAEGAARYEEVLERVMGYIELMRQSPFPDTFWEERATMARLAKVYTDRGEGADRATALANRALELPLEVAVDAPYTYLRQDPEFYFEILDRLRPDNLMVILRTQEVDTDRVESIYGTEYSYFEVGDDLFERLASPEIQASFTLPKANPFVPENVELLAEQPVRLIDEPGLSLYYAQDREFQRPKVAMGFKIRRPDQDYSAREAVLLELYQAAANEAINEIAYDALMADLAYSIGAGLEGITVSLFGYTESANRLLPYLVEALQDFSIEEERFEAIKDRMVRGWNNARFDNAFMYVRHFTNKASLRDAFLPDEMADAAESVSLKDVYTLRERLFRKGKIEALVYGNMTAGEAITAARKLEQQVGLRDLSEDKLYETQLVDFAPGDTVTFKDVLPGNNSVFRKDFMIGLATPKNRVAAAVLTNLIEAPYYTEMRTRQQLGYVVWSFTFNREDELRLGFVIQSGDYDPVELVNRSDALVSQIPELLVSMPSEAFEKAKAAVRSAIEVKPKTIGEKASRLFELAYTYDANWDRQQESLEALEALTLDDVVALAAQVNDPAQLRYQLVLLFARQHAEKAGQVEGVTDLGKWKAGRTFRKPTHL